jgi:hypothetical protein
MTQEEQRVSIAEACGWKYVEGLNVSSLSHSGATSCADCWVCPKRGAGYGAYEPPNYLNDLNAMHDAEKVLTNEQDLEYSEALEQVVEGRFVTNNAEDMRRLRSATASQRAEAFLRTIGKWEECK